MKPHPQDPEGPRAKRFRDWLRRDPNRRRAALERRFERGEDDTQGWSTLVLWLYVAGFILWGFRRILMHG